jgi:hypothetical protein
MARCIIPPVIGCLALIAGCASQVRTDQLAAARPYELTVEVRNYNYNAATVYASQSGYRDRLGSVETSNSETFNFRWVKDDVSFVVDFLGLGCVVTESIPVYQGDDLLLIIRVGDHEAASQSRCRLG